MSKKLQKHLASLELTKPGHRTNGPDNIDGEVIDTDVVEEFPAEYGEQPGPPGAASPAEEVEANPHKGL